MLYGMCMLAMHLFMMFFARRPAGWSLIIPAAACLRSDVKQRHLFRVLLALDCNQKLESNTHHLPGFYLTASLTTR